MGSTNNVIIHLDCGMTTRACTISALVLRQGPSYSLATLATYGKQHLVFILMNTIIIIILAHSLSAVAIVHHNSLFCAHCKASDTGNPVPMDLVKPCFLTRDVVT